VVAPCVGDGADGTRRMQVKKMCNLHCSSGLGEHMETSLAYL
jgi:hypothetical protein